MQSQFLCNCSAIFSFLSFLLSASFLLLPPLASGPTIFILFLLLLLHCSHSCFAGLPWCCQIVQNKLRSTRQSHSGRKQNLFETYKRM